MNRKRFKWIVTLLDAEKQTKHHVEFEAFWSPKKFTNQEVASACAAQTRYETKNQNLRGLYAELAP